MRIMIPLMLVLFLVVMLKALRADDTLYYEARAHRQTGGPLGPEGPPRGPGPQARPRHRGLPLFSRAVCWLTRGLLGGNGPARSSYRSHFGLSMRQIASIPLKPHFPREEDGEPLPGSGLPPGLGAWGTCAGAALPHCSFFRR